jgi:hypothetical protein
MPNDSLLLTGKGEGAKVQNEICGLAETGQAGDGTSPNEVGAEGRCGRAERGDGKKFGYGDDGDPSGARDPRRTPEDGGGEGKTFGHVDGGVRDPRRTNSGDGAGEEETFGHGDGRVRNPRRAQEDGRGEEETFGHENGGVRDPRRTQDGGGGEEETFGHGDGGDSSGARDPRRTHGEEDGGGDGKTFGHGGGGDPSGARDPRRATTFGHGEGVASDGPLAAERHGERCDAEHRDQGALQVVPPGAGREQVVASENQPDWRRAQMERMRREWMRRRAAKQGSVREHSPTVENGVTNGGGAPADAGETMSSHDGRGP